MLARCFPQTNTTLREITINGKLSLVEFRDGKTQELDLSTKGYGNEEAIIIGALLQVSGLFPRSCVWVPTALVCAPTPPSNCAHFEPGNRAQH